MSKRTDWFWGNWKKRTATLLLIGFVFWLWKPEVFVKVLSYFNRRGATFVKTLNDSTKQVQEELEKAEKQAKKHVHPFK